MPQGLSVSRLWLALVVAVFCVPLFHDLGRADTRDDEAIYSFAVDRLLETGDWLEPKSIPNDDWVFLEKPPLKFWIVAAPIRLGVLPDNEFGRRFWDALFGAVAFVYVFLIGCRLIGPACGAIAVLVLFVHQPLLIAHGLRSNNMEGPLFLAYCGGMFHFMAWTDDRSPASRWRHALAAGAYFTLGFMTKFVAVLFLPLVLGLTSLVAPTIRRRLASDWTIWLGVTALVTALVLPWFLWAHLKYGDFFWSAIFGAAVVTRFTEFLDPTHVQPWHFYWTSLWARLHDAHITWLALAGVVTLAVQTALRRSVDGAIVLLWLFLPLGLISLGTSKLYHYAYPFLPPVGLAIGYLCGLLLALGPVVFGRFVRKLELVGPFRSRSMRTGPLRTGLLLVAAVSVGIAVYSLVFGPLRISIDGREVFKSSGVFRPLVLAVVASLLTGAARGAVPVVVSVLVVSLLPLPTYRQVLVGLGSERSPIRAARDCVQRVQAATAGPGIYVAAGRGDLPYPIYYSFRHIRPMVFAESPGPEHLAESLSDPDGRWPILASEESYQAIRYKPRQEHVRSPGMAVYRDLGKDNMVLLLPGPYAVCEVEIAAERPAIAAR